MRFNNRGWIFAQHCLFFCWCNVPSAVYIVLICFYLGHPSHTFNVKAWKGVVVFVLCTCSGNRYQSLFFFNYNSSNIPKTSDVLLRVRMLYGCEPANCKRKTLDIGDIGHSCEVPVHSRIQSLRPYADHLCTSQPVRNIISGEYVSSLFWLRVVWRIRENTQDYDHRQVCSLIWCQKWMRTWFRSFRRVLPGIWTQKTNIRKCVYKSLFFLFQATGWLYWTKFICFSGTTEIGLFDEESVYSNRSHNLS